MESGGGGGGGGGVGGGGDGGVMNHLVVQAVVGSGSGGGSGIVGVTDSSRESEVVKAEHVTSIMRDTEPRVMEGLLLVVDNVDGCDAAVADDRSASASASAMLGLGSAAFECLACTRRFAARSDVQAHSFACTAPTPPIGAVSSSGSASGYRMPGLPAQGLEQPPVKRKRGRPPGSTKAKQMAMRAQELEELELQRKRIRMEAEAAAIAAGLPRLPFPCDYCPEGFNTAEDVTDHISSVHIVKDHKCDHCEVVYISVADLQVHMLDHQQEPYKCDRCPELSFPTKFAARAHLPLHFPDLLLACDQCAATFRRPDNLRNHMVVHSDARPFACDQCPKAFKRAAELRAHVAAHGNGFRCKQCGISFGAYQEFSSHMESVHGGEKEYPCRKCGMTFTIKTELMRHSKAEHSTKPVVEKPQACHFCGIMFSSKEVVREHILSEHEHELASKLFNCKLCRSTFIFKTDLMNHVRVMHK
ncbi:hypothetical protein BC830DRAFT_1095955 [Chytriomyces sp. MP71]|nr:hypothetical protein BC830DRAFT_1095955 [Chytriomyces sp. MP71]